MAGDGLFTKFDVELRQVVKKGKGLRRVVSLVGVHADFCVRAGGLTYGANSCDGVVWEVADLDFYGVNVLVEDGLCRSFGSLWRTDSDCDVGLDFGAVG